MKGIHDYAVVYDISLDRERRRVDKVLKDFGFRVQKSVFECRMNTRMKGDLIAALEKLKVSSGFIKIYRLDYTLNNPIIGQRPTTDIDADNAFVV